jgi:hypothetical protein
MAQVLAMSEAVFAPSESYSVIDRLVKLSPNFPDRAAVVLAALVKNANTFLACRSYSTNHRG